MTDPVPWRVIDAYLNNGATVARVRPDADARSDIPINDDLWMSARR
jgi:hypothetical protein